MLHREALHDFPWPQFVLVPYFKIRRAVRFRRSEVDAALERMRMGAA